MQECGLTTEEIKGFVKSCHARGLSAESTAGLLYRANLERAAAQDSALAQGALSTMVSAPILFRSELSKSASGVGKLLSRAAKGLGLVGAGIGTGAGAMYFANRPTLAPQLGGDEGMMQINRDAQNYETKRKALEQRMATGRDIATTQREMDELDGSSYSRKAHAMLESSDYLDRSKSDLASAQASADRQKWLRDNSWSWGLPKRLWYGITGGFDRADKRFSQEYYNRLGEVDRINKSRDEAQENLRTLENGYTEKAKIKPPSAPTVTEQFYPPAPKY